MDVSAFRNKLSAIAVGASVGLLSLFSAGGASADEAEDVENFRYSSWDLNLDPPIR